MAEKKILYHHKPDYMRMKLRTRKEIASWLLNELEHSYDRDGHYLFCFDCNNSSAEFSFNHLLANYDEASDDPTWLDGCQREYAERFMKWDPDEEDADEALAESNFDDDPDHPETLYEWGNEDAAGSFIGRGKGIPDDDCWNMLWDGTKVSVEFGFVDNGRSYDDMLCLKEFEGYTCTDRQLGELLEIDVNGLSPSDATDYNPPERLPWRVLKRLYEYVLTLKHFFDEDSYAKEISYQAGFSFFANICSEVPNPTEEKAIAERAAQRAIEEREEERQSRIAFASGFARRGTKAGKLPPRLRRVRGMMGMRRRVLHMPQLLEADDTL